jgi:hypothetical protein
MCCLCMGIVIGLKSGDFSPIKGIPITNPLASAPRATPTPNLKADLPLRVPGLNENGVELTVTAFQRPLTVQGATNLPPDMQFVLVSILARNTKTTGQPIAIVPTDFAVKGDGGQPYEANPKTVRIDNLLTAQDTIAASKSIERELIFPIAKDDSGLKLYWSVGKTTRVFVLEP